MANMQIYRRRSLFVAQRSAENEARSRTRTPVARPQENGLTAVQHIHPFKDGIRWDGMQHGGPPWRGVCIGGLWVGTHFYKTRRGVVAVTGVFGRVGRRPGLMAHPCKGPVKYRCRLMRGGHLLPFWWLSCGDPNHMADAGVIEHLDAQGRVTQTDHVHLQAALEAPAEVLALPPPEKVETPTVPTTQEKRTLPATPAPRGLLAAKPKVGSRRGWNGGRGR